MIDTPLISYNKEQEVLLMTKLKNKASPFCARVTKRSFSTSLVMAALATLSACDATNVDVVAHDVKATEKAIEPASKSPVDEQSEMFVYLDESDLIDAYYKVK
ncbi:conserved protein of unknown function [Alteromonas macleodii]|uniref:Uncharacterized protein n=2 Tax=Alteromonas macleodii TaxID=28108 RepID=A0A6T9XX92_ALTMA|nr:conserved protein of unknown function [Alteromonas macleodii]